MVSACRPFFVFTPCFAVFASSPPVGRVLRFLAVGVRGATAGLWDNGVLARFLCFFVSLSVRVKSRPTLPDGPDTERIHAAKRWVSERFSIEGVTAGSFCGGETEKRRVMRFGETENEWCNHLAVLSASHLQTQTMKSLGLTALFDSFVRCLANPINDNASR